jgi:hypothetical protein
MPAVVLIDSSFQVSALEAAMRGEGPGVGLPREKVAVMEQLFLETVDKLENRVMHLEQVRIHA